MTPSYKRKEPETVGELYELQEQIKRIRRNESVQAIVPVSELRAHFENVGTTRSQHKKC